MGIWLPWEISLEHILLGATGDSLHLLSGATTAEQKRSGATTVTGPFAGITILAHSVPLYAG